MRTLCLRGAFLTDGKTAALETAALKDYCLGHGRNLLEQWRLKFAQMFPGEECTIPAAAGLAFHRLRHGSLMSDGCSQARKMLELVRESVVESYKEPLAPGAWESMSEEEHDDAVRVHTGRPRTIRRRRAARCAS